MLVSPCVHNWFDGIQPKVRFSLLSEGCSKECDINAHILVQAQPMYRWRRLHRRFPAWSANGSGNMPTDGGSWFSHSKKHRGERTAPRLLTLFGKSSISLAKRIINGGSRYCIWVRIKIAMLANNQCIPQIEACSQMRLGMQAADARNLPLAPYSFVQIRGTQENLLLLPKCISREGVSTFSQWVITQSNLQDRLCIYDARALELGAIARVNASWFGSTCCGSLKRTTLLKYAWLEHLPGSQANRKNKLT